MGRINNEYKCTHENNKHFIVLRDDSDFAILLSINFDR